MVTVNCVLVLGVPKPPNNPPVRDGCVEGNVDVGCAEPNWKVDDGVVVEGVPNNDVVAGLAAVDPAPNKDDCCPVPNKEG